MKIDPRPFIAARRQARATAKARRKAARHRQLDAAERCATAKAFNDRYCYRLLYDPQAPRLPGTAMYGLLPRGGYRWMCPDCNHLHAPTECTVWSGLQYPACCTTGAGNRLSHGVRVK